MHKRLLFANERLLSLSCSAKRALEGERDSYIACCVVVAVLEGFEAPVSPLDWVRM